MRGLLRSCFVPTFSVVVHAALVAWLFALQRGVGPRSLHAAAGTYDIEVEPATRSQTTDAPPAEARQGALPTPKADLSPGAAATSFNVASAVARANAREPLRADSTLREAAAAHDVADVTVPTDAGAPPDDIEVARATVDSEASSSAYAVIESVGKGLRGGAGGAMLTDLSRPPVAPPLDSVLARNFPRDAVRARSWGLSVLRVEILRDGAIGQTSIVQESRPGFGRACDLTVRSGPWGPALDHTGDPIVSNVVYTCRFLATR